MAPVKSQAQFRFKNADKKADILAAYSRIIEWHKVHASDNTHRSVIKLSDCKNFINAENHWKEAKNFESMMAAAK